jgi:hypothetical protein
MTDKLKDVKCSIHGINFVSTICKECSNMEELRERLQTLFNFAEAAKTGDAAQIELAKTKFTSQCEVDEVLKDLKLK